MAASQHIHFTATFKDSMDIKAAKTSQLFIDPASTVTQMVTALNAWVTALTLITGAVIVRKGIGLSVPISAPEGTLVAGSEDSETVSLDFNQAALATHYGDVIPAFLESKLSGDQPNIADADVAAYITLLTTAPVLGGFYSGLGNEQLTSLYRAFQGDRKHRRAEFAKSVVYP